MTKPKGRPAVPKSTARKPLEEMTGTEARAVYVYGVPPFQPGDQDFRLEKITRSREMIEMTWRFTMGHKGRFVVQVEEPEGIEVSGHEIVIRRAQFVRMLDDDERREYRSINPGRISWNTNGGGANEFDPEGHPALRVV